MFSGSKAPESALQLANRSSGNENCHTRADARGASARVHTSPPASVRWGVRRRACVCVCACVCQAIAHAGLGLDVSLSIHTHTHQAEQEAANARPVHFDFFDLDGSHGPAVPVVERVHGVAVFGPV